MAHLVKIGDLQVGSLPDSAFVGPRSSPRIILSSVVLPAPFRADQAYLVPAQDRPGKLWTMVLSPKALLTCSSATILPRPLGTTGGDVHADAAHDFAAGLRRRATAPGG